MTTTLTDQWRKENTGKSENFNVDEEKKEKYKEKYRPKFEEEFEENTFPRHPYKIMQEIRKETGNYNASLEPDCFYLALEELKDEFEPKYHKLKKRYNS